jgi:hypothetical protein
MLAQAMECFYDKANEERASSSVTSMIAAQTSDYFDVAFRAAKEGVATNPILLGVGAGKQRLPREWLSQIQAKSFLFSAIGHFHSPLQLKPQQALGERIARLGVAKQVAVKAGKCSKDVGGVVHDIVKVSDTDLSDKTLVLHIVAAILSGLQSQRK